MRPEKTEKAALDRVNANKDFAGAFIRASSYTTSRLQKIDLKLMKCIKDGAN